MSRDDGMDEHGIDWLCGCHLVGFWLRSWANHRWFLSNPHHTSDQACDSHGPDDYPKTIDYHHLDMSRDDGMDEHGIDWLCECYGCHLVRFFLRSWANHSWWFLSNPNHKSDPAWLTWARWPPRNHRLSSSGHVKRWWHGWAWNWLALWMLDVIW
jgi:hypothetical protein